MDKKITIKFELTDECKCHFSSESTFEIFPIVGDDTLIEIGRMFRIFLLQAGYSLNNDFLFMESLTEEEYEVVSNFLQEYRKEDKNSKISDYSEHTKAVLFRTKDKILCLEGNRIFSKEPNDEEIVYLDFKDDEKGTEKLTYPKSHSIMYGSGI